MYHETYYNYFVHEIFAFEIYGCEVIDSKWIKGGTGLDKDFTKDRMEIGNLLKELFQTLKARLSKGMEGTGLTATQGMVMGNLHRKGRMKVSELSGILGLSNSTTSGILDRMENMGLIRRIRSEEDKRVVFVELNPERSCEHEEFHRRTEQTMQEVISKGTEEEIEIIIKGLTTLKDLLNR